MDPDILLVRHDDGYWILHGRLHLASIMNASEEVVFDVSGEGKVKVVKTPHGPLIEHENARLFIEPCKSPFDLPTPAVMYNGDAANAKDSRTT